MELLVKLHLIHRTGGSIKCHPPFVVSLVLQRETGLSRCHLTHGAIEPMDVRPFVKKSVDHILV